MSHFAGTIVTTYAQDAKLIFLSSFLKPPQKIHVLIMKLCYTS